MNKKEFLQKVIELLQTSVLVQSLITFGLVLTVIVLWLSQKDVPQQLYDFIYVVLGFYFGTKAQYTIMKGK